MEEEGAGFVEKEVARVMECREGAGEGRQCWEIERVGADVQVVQKPPAEVAKTANEEGTCTWAPASGGEGRSENRMGRGGGAGGLRYVCRKGGGEGWEEAMG